MVLLYLRFPFSLTAVPQNPEFHHCLPPGPDLQHLAPRWPPRSPSGPPRHHTLPTILHTAARGVHLKLKSDATHRCWAPRPPITLDSTPLLPTRPSCPGRPLPFWPQLPPLPTLTVPALPAWHPLLTPWRSLLTSWHWRPISKGHTHPFTLFPLHGFVFLIGTDQHLTYFFFCTLPSPPLHRHTDTHTHTHTHGTTWAPWGQGLCFVSQLCPQHP